MRTARKSSLCFFEFFRCIIVVLVFLTMNHKFILLIHVGGFPKTSAFSQVSFWQEMVQWLCRAPHMEQYFLSSLDIFKRNFQETDVAVLEVQKAMVQLQKECDESAEDDTKAMKKCQSILKKLLHDMEAVQKITQKRIDDELTPIIKRSFKYHDKDPPFLVTPENTQKKVLANNADVASRCWPMAQLCVVDTLKAKKLRVVFANKSRICST